MKDSELVANLVKIFDDSITYLREEYVPLSKQPIMGSLIRAGWIEYSQNTYRLTQKAKDARKQAIESNGGMTPEMQSRYIRVIEKAIKDANRISESYADAGRYEKAYALTQLTAIADTIELPAELEKYEDLLDAIKKWLASEKELLPKRPKKWAAPVEEIADIAQNLCALAGRLEQVDAPDVEASKIGRIWKWYNLD